MSLNRMQKNAENWDKMLAGRTVRAVALVSDYSIFNNYLLIHFDDDTRVYCAPKSYAIASPDEIAKQMIPGLARQVGVTTGWFD